MYDKGDKDSFQMFELDETQAGLLKGSPYWPKMSSKGRGDLRWQDIAILADAATFLYEFNWNNASYFPEKYSTLSTKYILDKPYYAHCTKEYRGSDYSEEVEFNLKKGWFGKDLLTYTEKYLNDVLSELRSSNTRYYWWYAYYCLPPQLGYGWYSGGMYPVNSLLGTLMSTYRWTLTKKAQTLDEYNDIVGRSYGYVLVRKGAVKFPTSAFKAFGSVRTDTYSSQSSSSSSNPTGSYNSDSDSETEYFPSSPYPHDPDGSIGSNREWVKKILGCDESDLTYKLQGMKIFKPEYNKEFRSQGLESSLVDASYEMLKTICDSDALFVNGSIVNWSSRRRRRGGQSQTTVDQVPSAVPEKWYGGSWSFSASESKGTGWHESDSDHGPRNDYKYTSGYESGDGITGAVDNWVHSAVSWYQGRHQCQSTSTDSDSDGPTSGTTNYVHLYRSASIAHTETEMENNDDGVQRFDMKSKLVFAFGSTCAFLKEDGGSTAKEAKILIPVRVDAFEYKSTSDSVYNYSPGGEDSEASWDSSYRLESEYKYYDITVYVPVTAKPFESKQNRESRAVMMWVSSMTTEGIVNEALKASGLSNLWQGVEPSGISSVNKPSRASACATPSGSQSGDTHSDYSASVTVYIGSSGSPSETEDGTRKYYYPYVNFGRSASAVVSFEPEMKKLLFGS